MDVIDRLFETEDEDEADRLVEALKALEYADVEASLRDRRRDLADAPPYSASHLAYLYTLFRIPIGVENFQKIIGSCESYTAGIFARYARHEIHRADGKKAVKTLEARLKGSLEVRDSDDLQEELAESLFVLGGKETQNNLRSMLPELAAPARLQAYSFLCKDGAVYDKDAWWSALNAIYEKRREDAALVAMRVLDPVKTEAIPERKGKPRKSSGKSSPGYFLP
jgi:hypothetical protein